MANINSVSDIWVVHKGSKKNSKIIIEVFKNMRVDDIIDANKRKPPIPHENEILEIGVGEFGEKYKKKYNL
jgi:hypothetical protein